MHLSLQQHTFGTSNMGRRTFFSKAWLHEYVEFEEPYPSRWKIVGLISEHPYQQNVQCEEDELKDSNPSYSKATFLCQNVRQPSFEAFLRVYMQIPHNGTEDASSSARSAQATWRSHDDIDALTLFRYECTEQLPWCLGVKELEQDECGWVPGGYMSYLLWQKLPGVRLDEEMFWSFERDERDAVREAFETAYRELYDLCVKPRDCGLKNLLWDKASGSLHIIGFGFTDSVSADGTWGEKVLAEWGLIIPLKGFKW